ncbi:MAG: LamG domain-containing protein [Oculatellaceae cyanobacterium Prado106]|nr:LamG domain-containing protein [Oculatellaceae cyanobacterium Prado106]
MLTSERFIKSYAKRPYQHATLVNHKGTLISFAMDTEGRIYYTTLNLEDTSRPDPTDSIYWSDDPVELLFPRELVHFGVDATPRTLPLVNQGRQAESPGTTLPADDQDTFLSSTARLTANAPFQVLSDGEYIYLFRQAIAANHPAQIFTDSERSSPLVNSTLLLDRFVLLGTTLQRKQEIRYQRSRNKFHPANEKDNLGAKDMEGNIFYEPTQALEFVGGLNHGRFYVLLLPTQQAEVRRWQIFVHNTNTQQIDSINVQQSPDGLFHIDNPSFPIHRFSFAFQGRSLVSGLSALLYYQQEKSKTGYDQQEKPLKRDARVMLAIATQTATHNRSEIAVVDFGVSSTGTLAQIPQSIQLPALQKPSTGGENSSNDQLDRIVERSEEAKALEREIQRINLTIDELNRQIEVLNRPKQATLYNEANSQGYFFNQTSSEGQKSSFIQIKSIKVAANSVVSVSARKIFDAAGRPLSNQPEIQIVQNAKDVPNLALPGDYGYVDTDPRPNSWQPQRNYELIVTVNTEASVAAQLQVLQNNLADQQNTLRSKENDLSQCLEAIAALKASVQNEIRLTMPLLQVDENGLSVSGAVLEFAWTKDTPQLFGSAAGQIGLYFRGENDQFFVAYYDTLTAKAQFKLPNSEVVFMAQSDQPEMDHLTLTVSAAATSQECQVDIRGGGITETWQRLPRDPQAFANILNGAASDPVYIGTLATQITANTTLTSLSLTPVLSMEMSDRGVLLLNDQTLNLTQSLRLGLEGTTTFPSQTVAIASTRFPQGIPANTPVYFRPYDYNRLVTSTPSPSSPFNTSLNNGSRLIRVNQGNSKENIPNGTASSLGSTLNCHWSANNPGNALQLDGQQTYAMLPTAQVSQMDAIQDVSLETWVKPDQVVGTARMIHQISNQSRYTLGLTQLPLGSRAFRFDTADDAIALPTSLHLDRRDFTVEAWIKFDSLVSQQPILMMMLPATNRVSNEFLHLMVRNRKAYLGFYDDDLAGERTLNENTWYHIAWRYTHATQEQAIFINGELDTKKIASGSLNSKRQLFFGKPWDAGMVAFRGAMDELRIWSTARSEDQIKATLNQRWILLFAVPSTCPMWCVPSVSAALQCS